jgi:hypothetical protein
MNRIEFEEMVMDCWQVTKDLDHVCDVIERSDMPAHQQDKLFNIVIGMKTLYEHKFVKLFESFEQMIKDGNIT